jgi:DNA-binding CsgD family transcriptional regulator
MNERGGQLLARIISAVGTPCFAETASQAMCAYSDFQLSSVVLHRGADEAPKLMFEDLAGVGYRAGIENYVRRTYRANPMLAHHSPSGIFRASDFRLGGSALHADLKEYLVEAPDEELGFRTVGWPPHMEELGLYFGACGGIVEFSLYRERSRRSAPARTLDFLAAMRTPLAAAFERHAMLAPAPDRGGAPLFSGLSARERDVARLLLAGCSSEAVSLQLGITRHTVKDHRKAIFRKLRIGSLAELFALSAGG